MQQVSKDEVELMLKYNILKTFHGRILDYVICSARKKSVGKQRYVTDKAYGELLRFKGRNK